MITVAWVLLMIALIVTNILELRQWKRAKKFADMAMENWKRSRDELEKEMKDIEKLVRQRIEEKN
jgi:undecaprenyl pyrophosphate synthase